MSSIVFDRVVLFEVRLHIKGVFGTKMIKWFSSQMVWWYAGWHTHELVGCCVSSPLKSFFGESCFLTLVLNQSFASEP